MTFLSKAHTVFRESITDAFQIGGDFEDLHALRRRAIRVILIFFLFVLLLNFLATKVFYPGITYHDMISAVIAFLLMTTLYNLQKMKRFFFLWLTLTSLFFADVVLMGYLDGTGLQVGALLLTVLMPLIGVYFIGRLGAIGCWVMGMISYAILFSISMSQPPPEIYFGGYSQIYDILVMAVIGLTLSLIIGLTLNEALISALGRARKSLARARTSELERTRFFGAVSHEIRNALNGIFGISASIMKDDLPEATRAKVELIQTSGTSLIRVLNDTLEITRLESGRMEMSNDCFELRKLCIQTALRWQNTAHDKGIEFNVSCSDDVPAIVRADQARIGQVLDNLLSNAFKFTQIGSVSLNMTAHELHDGRYMLRFSVTDTGCGVHPDRKSSIFDPYRQETGDTFARYGGTGLGLYICRLIAEQMQGHIWLERSDSEFTEFRFEFPVEMVDSLESCDDTHSLSGPDTLRDLRVIAVDDRLPNRRYLQTIFSSWELSLTTADSGADCLAKLDDSIFDVLLLDLNMPEMSGQELLQRVRALPTDNRNITVIVVSADGHEELRERLRGFGANLFVTKPLTPDMLWQALLDANLARNTAPPETDALS